MDYIYLTIVVIMLMGIAFWYLLKFNSNQLKNWFDEITFKKVATYGLGILLKSLIVMVLIIFIHNSFHEDHFIELTLFIIIFFIYSIVQSGYSVSGMLNRNKHVTASFIDFFKLSTNRLNKVINSIEDKYFVQASVLIKVAVVVAFALIFIPTASLYLTTNVLFLIIIAFFIVLSLLQNNIIFFGLTSLIVFQFNNGAVSFTDYNGWALMVSFLIIVIGTAVETRLERRMFILIRSMEVKRFNFNLGYTKTYESKSIIMYENIINHYYYIYYRKTGIVLVYHSLLDPKVSSFLLRRMVKYGIEYLKKYGEY